MCQQDVTSSAPTTQTRLDLIPGGGVNGIVGDVVQSQVCLEFRLVLFVFFLDAPIRFFCSLILPQFDELIADQSQAEVLF